MVSSLEKMDDLAHVEQELEDLQSHIKQQFSVLEDLSKVHSQLSSVSQFQDKYQANSRKIGATLERLEEAQGALRSRADELDSRIQTLVNEHHKFKQTFEQTMARCAEEWTQQQDSVRAYINEFENRLKKDFQHTVSRVSKTGMDSTLHRERLEKLDVRVRGLSSSIKNINTTLRAWNGLAIGVTVVGLLGFVVLALVFL
ncbi:MAG: hypothetical protein F6K42_20705 [Leptolyngbya sp. SIO1D8]|nr:hypothetical protein [Leptolyngbya sp. SIO1D8]